MWLQGSGAEAGQQLWMLKTAQHLGKGLRLLPATQALEEAAKARWGG